VRLFTRLLGWLVRWATSGTWRRRVGLVAIPVLVVVALTAPRGVGNTPTAPPRVLGTAPPTASGGTGAAPGTTLAPTGLPDTSGPPPSGPTVAPRPEPTLPTGAGEAAIAYVTTVNTHDARPGRDHGFADSYVRARALVTPALYAVISAPSRRGDYQWTRWSAARATVSVQPLRAAVPDGAPVPTATSAHVRVLFRQVVTPHVAGKAATTESDALSVVVTKDAGGSWRVSRLLADT
jgi:hypothetical protein